MLNVPPSAQYCISFKRNLSEVARWWNSEIKVNQTQGHELMGHPLRLIRSLIPDGGAVVERVAAEVDKVDRDDVAQGDHGEDGEDHEAALVAPPKRDPPLIAAVPDEVAPVRGTNLGVGVRPGHFDSGGP